MIDLGKKETIGDGCCDSPTKEKKKTRYYYPSIYIDSDKDIDLDDDVIDKDIVVEAKVCVKRITKSTKADSERYGKEGKKTTSISIDVKAIDFTPKKGKESKKDMASTQQAIEDAFNETKDE